MPFDAFQSCSLRAFLLAVELIRIFGDLLLLSSLLLILSLSLRPLLPCHDVLLRFYEQKSISGYMMRLLESISRTKQLLVATRKTSARHQRLGLIRK